LGVIKWNAIFTRLMKLMDTEGGSYFSGPRFLGVLREFNEDLPNYSDLMEERRLSGKSTTRAYYFKDLLMELDEGTRIRAVTAFLDVLETVDGNLLAVSEIRKLLGGTTLAPRASIPAEAWNAERLNSYLSEIDAAITQPNYERAVGLAYTCFEGFLGAFVRAKEKREQYPTEIIELSKEVKKYLKNAIKEYPDEVLNGITQAAYAIDKARNRFSDAHFGSEAGSWLATYVRDLVNTHIRLLLHFM
jgi:hypothetical protein